MAGRSRIEVAADHGEVGVAPGLHPFQELFRLILPRRVFHSGCDEMSHVRFKESSVDLETRHEGDAIVGASSVCRLDYRVAGEQPLGLCVRVLPDFGLLQQGISHRQPFRRCALKPTAGLLR